MVLGEDKIAYQKCLECDFRLIWRTKNISVLGSPKVGGGGPRLGHNLKLFLFLLVTPPLSCYGRNNICFYD